MLSTTSAATACGCASTETRIWTMETIVYLEVVIRRNVCRWSVDSPPNGNLMSTASVGQKPSQWIPGCEFLHAASQSGK